MSSGATLLFSHKNFLLFTYNLPSVPRVTFTFCSSTYRPTTAYLYANHSDPVVMMPVPAAQILPRLFPRFLSPTLSFPSSLRHSSKFHRPNTVGSHFNATFRRYSSQRGYCRWSTGKTLGSSSKSPILQTDPAGLPLLKKSISKKSQVSAIPSSTRGRGEVLGQAGGVDARAKERIHASSGNLVI